MTIVVSQQVLSDPVNGTANPLAIPGALIEYSILVENRASYAIDANSLCIDDFLAQPTHLLIGDPTEPSIAFEDGPDPSGLTFQAGRDVAFSNNPGGEAPFSYEPEPNPHGVDRAVTAVRIMPKGSMNPSADGHHPSFILRFVVEIE